MWWCFGCYFCLPILFTVLCQLATRNVNSDSTSTQKQRNLDDRSSNQKRQQHQAVERQLNCTLLALAVMYGICALPEHVCNITLAYTDITISEDTAAMLALLHHFLLFFKASVTPVLLLCLCKVSLTVEEGLLESKKINLDAKKCETVNNSITETQNYDQCQERFAFLWLGPLILPLPSQLGQVITPVLMYLPGV